MVLVDRHASNFLSQASLFLQMVFTGLILILVLCLLALAPAVCPESAVKGSDAGSLHEVIIVVADGCSELLGGILQRATGPPGVLPEFAVSRMTDMRGDGLWHSVDSCELPFPAVLTTGSIF